jgi:putative transposase
MRAMSTWNSTTIRRWRRTSGPPYANQPRRQRPKSGDAWRLDEVFLKINGQTRRPWRAVDQGGNVLDIPVQRRHNQMAAERSLFQAWDEVTRARAA